MSATASPREVRGTWSEVPIWDGFSNFWSSQPAMVDCWKEGIMHLKHLQTSLNHLKPPSIWVRKSVAKSAYSVALIGCMSETPNINLRVMLSRGAG